MLLLSPRSVSNSRKLALLVSPACHGVIIFTVGRLPPLALFFAEILGFKPIAAKMAAKKDKKLSVL
jgi:hypothetical protein